MNGRSSRIIELLSDSDLNVKWFVDDNQDEFVVLAVFDGGKRHEAYISNIAYENDLDGAIKLVLWEVERELNGDTKPEKKRFFGTIS